MMNLANTSKVVFDRDRYFCECLFSAYLIDNQSTDHAREILENIYENAELEDDLNLKRMVYFLLGNILKNNKADHSDVTRGLKMLEEYDEIESKDKYSEWSHFYICEPDKYKI
jgi:hypothetical protein